MKKVVAFMCMLVSLLMTGCTFGAGVDTLLVPPQLNEQESAIKKALMDSVGKNIKLKYPKTGEYRSAIIIENIDDEPTDEAIVFYQNVNINDESNVRINILDEVDGNWISVFDKAGNGTDIDRTLIAYFDSGIPGIVVGYNALNQKVNTVDIYTYNGERLVTDYTDSYSTMTIADMDNEGRNDLILISNTGDGNANTARVIKKKLNMFFVTSSVDMNSEIVKYTDIKIGKIEDDITALYVDADVGNGNIETEILYSIKNEIRNPIAQIAELLSETSRTSGYESIDIDSDKEVEIPVLYPFPGYETVDVNQQLYVTEWMSYQIYSFGVKYISYYNKNESYCFMIPSRWQGAVTVKKDNITGETVFYKYEGNLNSSNTELMRIYTKQSGKSVTKDLTWYNKIYADINTEYYVKISENTDEGLVPTLSEVQNNLIVI